MDVRPMDVPSMVVRPMGGEWMFAVPTDGVPTDGVPTREALVGVGTGFAVPPWA